MPRFFYDNVSRILTTITTLLCVAVMLVPLLVIGHGPHILGVGGPNNELDALRAKIEKKRAAVEELEKSIAGFKKKMTQSRLESVSLKNQLGMLDTRSEQIETEIAKTTQRLGVLELEIESYSLQIAQKAKALGRQKELIAELIRTIHIHDNKKYFEIALSYDSFSEFYNQVQYLASIDAQLGEHAQLSRVAKQVLEEKKKQKEGSQALYENVQDELEQKKKDLDEQKAAKHTLLSASQSSEKTFQSMVARLKKEYQHTENEIRRIEKEIRKKIEEEKKRNAKPAPAFDTPVVKGSLAWPTQSRYITARFHDPTYPYRHIFEHSGLDIRAGQRTPLKAAASGYVARARVCRVASCYGYVMLVHAGGVSTVYGHMSQITVKDGQFVTTGDMIGYSGGMPGTRGAGSFTTGPHLHFEVRKNGIPVNPLLYLVKDY